MKKTSTLLKLTLFFVVCLFSPRVFSQNTAGNLAFSVTTASSGTYGAKHIVAIWIEDNNGNFVKTLLKNYAHQTRKQYLNVFIAKSAENGVDAISGGTLTSHTAPLVVSWNGKDVNQNIVADGTYKLGIQMAWVNTNGPVSYFTFTKGTSVNTGVTTATANYTNMSLVWTPTTTGIENNQTSSIMVYPNPTSNMLNINLGSKAEDTKLEIYNVNGQLVVSKNFSNASGILTENIINFTEGVYFVSVRRNSETIRTKIIVKK